MTSAATGPDEPRLRAICAEADRLQAEGSLTRERYRQLLDDAKQASHGDPRGVECMMPYAEPGWVTVEAG